MLAGRNFVGAIPSTSLLVKFRRRDTVVLKEMHLAHRDTYVILRVYDLIEQPAFAISVDTAVVTLVIHLGIVATCERIALI